MKITGYDLWVYVNLSGWSTAVGDWDAVPFITDSSLPEDAEEASSKSRSSKQTKYDITWINGRLSITFEVDESDTTQQAILAAGRAAPATVIGVGVGPRDAAAGDKLYAFDAVVKVGEEAHPNDGPKTRTVEFLPAMRGTHDPDFITLTA